MKVMRTLLILSAFAALPLFADAETFVADRNHSNAMFKVRHMMANVVGQFRDFTADVNIDRANPEKSSVEFTIQAASIDTGNTNRDNHLRSGDFFDVEKFPAITFKSKRVTLPVTFLGFLKTPRGEKAGFEIETTIDRKDYGVVWNRNLDEGGVLLGDDVKVTINLEMDKKAPAAAAPAATK